MATTHDLVRRFFPEATDDECNFWLWETTCYPFGKVLQIARQLKTNAKAAKNGSSVCPRCGGAYKREGKASFYELCTPCETIEREGK